MADTDVLLSELAEETSPTPDAFMYVLNDPNGVPADRKVQLVNAMAGGGGKFRLTADRTYYVRTDGSDSHTGLIDSSAGAFLTIQKAITTVISSINLNGYAVTIQVGDGTYTENISMASPADGGGGGTLSIKGENSATPTTVIINGNVTFSGNSIALIQGFVIAGTLTVNGSRITLGSSRFTAGAGVPAIILTNDAILTSSASIYAHAAGATGYIFINCDRSYLSFSKLEFVGSPTYDQIIKNVEGTVKITDFVGTATSTQKSYTYSGVQRYADVIPSGADLFGLTAVADSTSASVVNTTILDANITSTDSTTAKTVFLKTNDFNIPYSFEAVLFTTSNSAAGVKIIVNNASISEALCMDGTTVVSRTRSTSSPATVVATTAMTAASIIIRGTVPASSSVNFWIEAYQNVTNAAATTILAGSHITFSPRRYV